MCVVTYDLFKFILIKISYIYRYYQYYYQQLRDNISYYLMSPELFLSFIIKSPRSWKETIVVCCKHQYYPHMWFAILYPQIMEGKFRLLRLFVIFFNNHYMSKCHVERQNVTQCFWCQYGDTTILAQKVRFGRYVCQAL